ncbi:MAG: metallophosphoesterase [Bacteroidetes bacterium]|nr:metallophosphoesterase [Bacteroidota bacterium]
MGRCGEDFQKEVSEQLAITSKKTNADFIISTGDNFYPKGVLSINDPLWDKSYEDIYHQFSLQKDWYVVLGNHDVKTNAEAEVEYTKKSVRWHMPQHYYSIKIPISKKDTTKKILLVFLDTNPFVGEYYKDLIMQNMLHRRILLHKKNG